jgi:hypothetical protein
MATKKKTVTVTTPPNETIIAYKGFGADWKCRDMQYVVGQSYTHDGEVVACGSGFHACENPLDVLKYYPLVGSKFAEVEQSGTLARHSEDTKVASSKITIKAELGIAGFVKASIEWIRKQAEKPTSGDCAHSATSGYGAHSATSGDCANSATSGYGAHSATSGNGAHSATSGDCAHSATSGNGAHSATSGNGAHSATSGDGANSATSGYGAHSATSGYGAHSATSGDGANSATSGYGANSATSGYGANVEAKGKNAVAGNCGNGRAKAGVGGAIFIVERDSSYNILAVFASKVGENGIVADTWYALKGGKPVESAP